MVVFAVRLDTFERGEETSVFYVGSNDTAELEGIRRHILATFKTLPIAGEYIHRDAFDPGREVWAKTCSLPFDTSVRRDCQRCLQSRPDWMPGQRDGTFFLAT